MKPLLILASVLLSTMLHSADNEPSCDDSDIETLLSWTNTVSCHFYMMSINYTGLAGGIDVRVRGQIEVPLNEEDPDAKSTEESEPSAPVDANSPINQILELRGSAVKGFAGLQPYFQKRVLKMGIEYKNMFNEKLIINSAYRSPAHQAELFNAALAKYGTYAKARKHVAPPGRSRHNTGLAVDVDMQGGQGDKLFSSGIMQRNDSWRPMSYERWHIEPIESKATRNGASSPAVLDSNLSRKVGDTTASMDFSAASLSKKYEVLSLKSRYSQEITLMVVELLLTRNRMAQREEMEEYARKLIDTKGYYDEDANKEDRIKKNKTNKRERDLFNTPGK